MAYCAYCGSYTSAASYAPCASCGNPTNGAPARPARVTSSTAMVLSVTAGGCLVLFFAAILASVAIPNLMVATERARQRRTMADMRTLATAIEEYAKDHNGDYPGGTRAIDLQATLVPTYARELPVVDGWGSDYWYTHTDAQYVLTSLGDDGEADENVHLSSPLATQNADRDIILVNGKFMQYPERLQP